jgi:hypothetical protein
MPGRQCPWCSAPVPEGATSCPSCQAALVDTTGGLAIPGLTAVDPQVVAGEAAAHDQFERALHPKQRFAAGLVGGGLLGAIVAGAVGAASSTQADDDAGPAPWGGTDLRALDAKLAADQVGIPGAAAALDPWSEPAGPVVPSPWGPVGMQSFDTLPAARPNELSDMGEPNVAHWPEPADTADPADADPPPWGPLTR